MSGALITPGITFLPCPRCGESLERAVPTDVARQRRCAACGTVSHLNDIVKPYARLTGRLWIFGVVLMAGAVRLETSLRTGFMTAGLVIALWAAVRTVRQFKVLAR